MGKKSQHLSWYIFHTYDSCGGNTLVSLPGYLYHDRKDWNETVVEVENQDVLLKMCEVTGGYL